MDIDAFNLKIVLILTVGFGFASIFGYLTQRAKLSPILGYLLAGYFIGPYSPGFVADLGLSEQLAEIGVILMMFGVGMHFKYQDLLSVKNIAIPGALGQTFAATLISAILIHSIGWSWEAGIIIGLAVGVASTVVLVRVLSDNLILNTPEGHISVGWLVVEDILTVLALILLPALHASSQGESFSTINLLGSFSFVIVKFLILVVFMFTVGQRIIKFILFKVARVRSHELFTLTVVALIFIVAAGSTEVFGTSIALGAFIAGMVIGQTDVRHQASVNSLPLQDIFIVIFFLSIGMLFNPWAITAHPFIFIGILAIILIIKPLVAFLLVLALKYPFKTALTVGLALAQIGEFSFILAEEAVKSHIIPDEGYDIIVACALVSIAINPLFFKSLNFMLSYVEKKINPLTSQKENIKTNLELFPKALVIGFGRIGQSIQETLQKKGFTTIVIDRNVDAIAKLIEENQAAYFGDATLDEILKIADIKSAKLLIITTSNVITTSQIIKAAYQLNPTIQILARTRYMADEEFLKDLGAQVVCGEKEELIAFNDALFTLAKFPLHKKEN